MLSVVTPTTPMTVVVVVAHPCTDSFTHATAEAAVRGLRAAGHHVEVLDLYAVGFRAAMSLEEHLAYGTDEPLSDPMAEAHGDLVARAHALVFVYPTWWSGLPAILKGWFDRTLVAGVAFTFDNRGKPQPGLSQLRHLVGISTYGSPRRYVKAVNDNGRRMVSRALRMSCGMRVRSTWCALYAIDTATAEQRAAFLRSVEATTKGLR
jgi:NAD(P)H dehydrogenase (quinone)